jgi:hypothetical protein
MATSFYEAFAAQQITVDETAEGQLFCQIPSEKDVNVCYTLNCIEHKDSVEVQSCSCKSCQYRGTCKHVEICQSYWNKIYKSNQEKREAIEAEKAIAEAEAIVVAPKFENCFRRPNNWATSRIEREQNYIEIRSQMREIRERNMLDAPLNGNKGFSLMRV